MRRTSSAGRRSRASSALAVLSLALTFAGRLHAQTAQDKAAAEVLFDEGKQLMRQKRYSLACPKFLESNKLDAGLGTILWLADCYEKNGQTASAWGQFREAAEIASRQHDPREKVARERASRLEPSLVRMTIVIGNSTAVPGMAVTRDGVEVAQTLWGESVPVDPGPHTISVSAPHKKPWESTVTVQPGSRNVDVPVPPLEAVPEPPPPPPPQASGGGGSISGGELEHTTGSGSRGVAARAVGGVAIGLGIVGLGFGTYFGLQALFKNNNSKTGGCGGADGNMCNMAGTSLRNTALSDATGSTVAFVVGGILTTGGIVTVLAAPSGPAKKESVSLSPWVNRNGIGVGMGGAW
jgi:hypothetical protein